MKEKWKQIIEFPDYSVSNMGNVRNDVRNKEVVPNATNYGHLKVCFTPMRYSRSVAQLVADYFVPAFDELSDCVILLDGDFENCKATNLAWRPRYFAYKYARQMRTQQPLHYKNLHVRNMDRRITYDNIVAAGIAEGMLFEDIWESVCFGRRPYPFHHRYKNVERV